MSVNTVGKDLSRNSAVRGSVVKKRITINENWQSKQPKEEMTVPCEAEIEIVNLAGGASAPPTRGKSENW